MVLRLLLTLLACSPDGGTIRMAPDDTATSTGDTGTDDTASADTATEGPCPAGMADLGTFCIDRWEAHLVDASPYEPPSGSVVAATASDTVPQGYISGTHAAAACAAAGKHLCGIDEWLHACRGASERTYPYGNTYDSDACNSERSPHPVVELFGSDADWSPGQMNDPRLNQLPDSLDTTGANTGCVTPEGVFDLHGNLHEWVDDPEGTFKGGFYVDAVLNGPGCTYTTTAHSVGYHDYSTGFRCCANRER